MSKPPLFELPVKKEKLPRNTKNIDLYRIDGAYFPYTKEEADYIVQVINNYEKLVAILRKFRDECDDNNHNKHHKEFHRMCKICVIDEALKEAGEPK